MLSIEEIKDISFKRAGRHGYNDEEVDEFIDEVIDTVEHLQAENKDLIRKMDILAKKVEQYREEEETVRGALLQSQKISDNALKDAKNRASLIIKAAEKKARDIQTEADLAIEQKKERFEAIQADTAQLRKEIIALYKEHIAMVEKMPTDEDVERTRRELDEKYPFEGAEEIIESTDVDFDVEEEMVKAVNPDDDDDGTVVREPRRAESSKFDKLKFGDNYDVE